MKIYTAANGRPYKKMKNGRVQFVTLAAARAAGWKATTAKRKTAKRPKSRANTSKTPRGTAWIVEPMPRGRRS